MKQAKRLLKRVHSIGGASNQMQVCMDYWKGSKEDCILLENIGLIYRHSPGFINWIFYWKISPSGHDCLYKSHCERCIVRFKCLTEIR